MFNNPNIRRRQPGDNGSAVKRQKVGDTNILNPTWRESKDKPREAEGRTNRRAAQNQVSATVRFDALNSLRAKREEEALPGTWLEAKNDKAIEEVRRGDIALSLIDTIPFSYETGLTNSATCFKHLNKWSKAQKFRVAGIVDNPSRGRGITGKPDNFGNLQIRGSNTLTNLGDYTIVNGDRVYYLPIPETTEYNGVTYSMNAVKGTGDGSGPHEDYNQSLTGRYVPLKFSDIKLTLETVRFEIDERLRALWDAQTNGQSINDIWTASFVEVQAALIPEKVYLIPGMDNYSMMYYYEKSVTRCKQDLFNGVDVAGTVKLLKTIYKEAHERLRAYWATMDHEFRRMANPDDLKRLGRNSGSWLAPIGLVHIHNMFKETRDISVDLEGLAYGNLNVQGEDDADAIIAAVSASKLSPMNYLDQLTRILSYTMGWIEANDITQFLESCYIATCISAQAGPGKNFDCLR